MTETSRAPTTYLEPYTRRPCARVRLSTHPSALAHCEKCVRGTLEDYAAFTCMGKLLYLQDQYDPSCDYYVRAAAVHVLRHTTPNEQSRFRRYVVSLPKRAKEVASTKLAECEPTLIYHLGHSWHCFSSGKTEHRAHLERYAKGLRGLAPEADELSPSLLLYFHDQGLTALRQKSSLLFTVFEQYYRAIEKQP